MQFNIEEGGTLISLEQIISIIKASHPDAVCILEAAGNLPRIAQKLGWTYYDTRLQIISQYPLIDPPEGKGIYTYLEISPGKIIALSNVHLPAELYGPRLFLEGASHSIVTHIEKKMRLTQLEQHLKVLPSLAAQGIPTFLAGDFNAPSHLDWTEEAVTDGFHQHRCTPCKSEHFEWPVSKALEEVGFRDSYRELHPNPTNTPGFTWWSDRPRVPGWNPQITDPHDRIDFIYVAGPAKTIRSERIGSCCAPSSFSPWPSDHCAVVSTFDLTPAQAPTLIGVHKRVVEVGEPMSLTYRAPYGDGHALTLVHASTQTAVASKPLGNNTYGTSTFSTLGWQAQPYEAHLLNSEGKIISRIPFAIRDPAMHPILALTKKEYRYTEPIVVSWKHGLGHRGDWLGIVPQEAHPQEHIMWEYTKAELEGTYSFDATRPLDWPLAPGDYTLGYFIDDTFQMVDQVNFMVHQES